MHKLISVMMGFAKITANNFQIQYLAKLKSLYQEKTLTDVSLVSDDQKHFLAHRVVLASVSPVFSNILLGLSQVQYPVIYLKDVRGDDLSSVLEFIYTGTLCHGENRARALQLLKDFKLDELFENTEDTKASIKDEREVVENTSIDKDPDDDVLDGSTGVPTNTDNTDETKKVLKKEKKESELKRFNCNYCDYIAIRSDMLKSHINRRHLNIKSYVTCDQCGASLAGKSALFLHIKSIHEKVRYHCDYENCDYTATNKGAIKIHKEGKHEGISYLCDQCDYKTLKKSLLKRHMIVMHGDVDLPCGVGNCDFKTRSKKTLKMHKEVNHEGIRYACQECGFRAKRPNHLKDHMESLHGEPKYLCSQCPYKANTRRKLKTHTEKEHS